MRARMALKISGQAYAHREILLRDKPDEMIEASPKATVPVLKQSNGDVLEESLDIMFWALDNNDPGQWLSPEKGTLEDMRALIAENDGTFKHHLDRYKYAVRYSEDTDPVYHRTQGAKFLETLNNRLGETRFLFGNRPSLADFAIFPFVRQFANTDREWFDGQPFDRLQDWLEGHLNSDLFTGIMKKYPLWSAEMQDIFPASDATSG